ncbi:MAG: hypothetical protein F6K32_24455 [Desertifilum sp. SIO1I2]|nr:hypothetical protein [Desertifilum sp. SIO1I2]
MNHQAFVFDHNAFIKELSNILEKALRTNESHELIDFIDKNILSLKDPIEGEALDFDWRKIIHTADISQYGDLALTKYYDPKRNIGVGYDWMLLSDFILEKFTIDDSLLLGMPFGLSENHFNPGLMGSYFQSPEQVQWNAEIIKTLSKEQLELLPQIVLLKRMFLKALALKKGLYITF